MNDTTTKKFSLDFQGVDMNVQKAVDFENKVNNIKSKILENIQQNMNFETGLSSLSASMKILKDTPTHTIITLRCGAYKVLTETVIKGQYTNKQLLDNLAGLVKQGDFDKQITKYANTKRTRKTKQTEKKK